MNILFVLFYAHLFLQLTFLLFFLFLQLSLQMRGKIDLHYNDWFGNQGYPWLQNDYLLRFICLQLYLQNLQSSFFSFSICFHFWAYSLVYCTTLDASSFSMYMLFEHFCVHQILAAKLVYFLLANKLIFIVNYLLLQCF